MTKCIFIVTFGDIYMYIPYHTRYLVWWIVGVSNM